ncbi:hypothetical protein A1A1_17620 [Planococcus antarcticus DSM 14505]|uniref:Aerobactin siderophore biosynthesis IucA/IucC-like C-terminal domain-containing protein n=1 Tax=Planococcus antarcticus DSM 14505 TaxID=1185653 RepID=A0A1C7DHC5_9BACL|nr:hypothetical protein [Planococcus antarcticus]ANU10812.1 hypothetical protein BBH88_11070 [Planococcus antarcticus DSM 14505]EIM05121.1 hypothetical protein A1A1_17620 [Planococcus antarcticus DSM 14505]
MLSEKLQEYLEEHSVTIGHEKDSFLVKDLIDKPALAKQMIQIQTQQMNQCTPIITGTIFGKRYSVLAMVFLDLYIKYGILLDLQPSNVGIVLRNSGGMRYTLGENAIPLSKNLSSVQERMKMKVFIKDHLLPLFSAISKETKSQESHMHSLVSHNFFQKSSALKESSPEQSCLIDETLSFLLSEYGVRQKNGELYRHEYRLYSSPDEPEKFYLRNHCCLSYLLHDGDKNRCCRTCPLLSEDQRQKG